MNTFNELMYQIDGEETFESSLYNSLFTDNYYIEKDNDKEVKQDLTPEDLIEFHEKMKKIKKAIMIGLSILAIITVLLKIKKSKDKKKAEAKSKANGASLMESIPELKEIKDKLDKQKKRINRIENNMKEYKKNCDHRDDYYKRAMGDICKESEDVCLTVQRLVNDGFDSILKKFDLNEINDQERHDTIAHLTDEAKGLLDDAGKYFNKTFKYYDYGKHYENT